MVYFNCNKEKWPTRANETVHMKYFLVSDNTPEIRESKYDTYPIEVRVPATKFQLFLP